MRVLVCGGRDFAEPVKLRAKLDTLHRKGMTVVIQGGAKGADYVAKMWAEDNGVNSIQVNAEWEKYGKAAGHIRNSIMLKQGQPDLVLATRGGRGTANMIKQANNAGVPVIHL